MLEGIIGKILSVLGSGSHSNGTCRTEKYQGHQFLKYYWESYITQQHDGTYFAGLPWKLEHPHFQITSVCARNAPDHSQLVGPIPHSTTDMQQCSQGAAQYVFH